MKYWEIIADRLHGEGWSYGIAEHLTKHGLLFASMQELTAMQQQQQIEVLAAGLQKVSAAVELNKAAPTQVADTR